jgi:hypothetical protein
VKWVKRHKKKKNKNKNKKKDYFLMKELQDIVFSEKENMKVKIFFSIINALISNLNNRKKAYNELNEKFDFF